MKITKNQLKELIKLSIAEVVSEQDDEDKPFPPKKDDEEKEQVPSKSTSSEEDGVKKIKTDIEINPFDDEEVEEEQSLEELKFGSKAQYDAYKKKHDIKPGTKIDIAGKKSKEKGKTKMSKKAKSLGDKMADKLNKRMADLEKKSKQGRVKESKGRRCTVKEIKKWFKSLEENRYKKTYASDARRVSWMVNHIGESLDNMPISMKKKWSKAQYGRERYLAKEFLKSKNVEHKLRESIRKIIKRFV